MKVPEAISKSSPQLPEAKDPFSAEHIMTFASLPNYSKGKVQDRGICTPLYRKRLHL